MNSPILSELTNIILTKRNFCIKRINNDPYEYEIVPISLDTIANVEKKLPDDFIDKENLAITDKCKEYLVPFVSGEIYPKYNKNGKPRYISFT